MSRPVLLVAITLLLVIAASAWTGLAVVAWLPADWHGQAGWIVLLPLLIPVIGLGGAAWALGGRPFKARVGVGLTGGLLLQGGLGGALTYQNEGGWRAVLLAHAPVLTAWTAETQSEPGPVTDGPTMTPDTPPVAPPRLTALEEVVLGADDPVVSFGAVWTLDAAPLSALADRPLPRLPSGPDAVTGNIRKRVIGAEEDAQLPVAVLAGWIEVATLRDTGTVRDGPTYWWTAEERLVAQATYADGTLQGRFFTLKPDGTKDVDGQFDRGKRDGVWVTHTDGRRFQVWDMGTRIFDAADAAVPLAPAPPALSPLSCPDGSVRDASGDVERCVLEDRPEIPEGPQRLYWRATTHLTEESVYVEGKRQGPSRFYWLPTELGAQAAEWCTPRCPIAREIAYEDGIRSGLAQTWHPNGQKASSARYSADVPCGIAETWSADGTLQKREEHPPCP